MLHIIKIIRPLNILLSVLTLLISAFLLGELYNIEKLIIPAMVIILFASAGNIINDIFDFKTDMINRPDRVIPSGLISITQARIAVFILFGLGISLSYYLLPLARIITLFFILPLLVFYTPFFKRIPLLGNVIVSAILGVVFIYSEASLTGEVHILWIPALLAFGLSLIRELVKDMADVKGDIIQKVNTFPVKYGLQRSVYIVSLFVFVLCILSPLPYYYNIYGKYYLIILVIGVQIPLIFSTIQLWKNANTTNCIKVSKLLKVVTIVGMIVILISKYSG
jgi:geranylgeranylglycerol-phosphate geranylgeranyltransferase